MMKLYKCYGLTSLRGLFSRNNMKQVTAIIVGAGARGTGYAQYALDFPNRFKVRIQICSVQAVRVRLHQVSVSAL